MKTRRNLLTFLGLIMSLSIIAQTPGVNYQAVLRDQAGDPMPGENVGLIISLIDDSTGDLIYKERHDLMTNDLGMLNTLIGTGMVEEGLFEEIIGIQDLSLQLQAVIPGEPDIVDIGSSKVGSVPFALYGEDADADPDNELQSISTNGDSLTISEMGGVELNAINYWEKTDNNYFLEFTTSSREIPNAAIFTNSEQKGTELWVTSGDHTHASISPVSLEFASGESNNPKKEIGCTFEISHALLDGSLSYTYTGTSAENQGNTTDQAIREKSKENISRVTNTVTSLPPLNGFLNLFGQLFVGHDLREETHFDRSFLNSHAIVEDVSAKPLMVETDFMTFNENLEKAGLKKIDEEEYNEYQASSPVVISRRANGELELRSSNGFSLVNKTVYSEMYADGMFGVGSTVASTDESQNFGGTIATANQNGMTSLTGAVPGIDPSIPWNILFNGANLGVTSTINSESAATVSTYGANGQRNTVAGTFAEHPDGGAFLTFDPSGALGAYMWTQTDGSSQIGADQFVMTASPPSRSNDVEAVYSAPMGGEAATYDRGTANLVNGEATIKCPESFQWVADENSMTVTITPLSADSKGIAVIEKSNGGFKVKELSNGKGNYAFDYLVMCKRKGHEDYQVIRLKPEIIKSQAEKIKEHLPKGPITSIRDLGGASEK